jgi:hypothetical protein
MRESERVFGGATGIVGAFDYAQSPTITRSISKFYSKDTECFRNSYSIAVAQPECNFELIRVLRFEFEFAGCVECQIWIIFLCHLKQEGSFGKEYQISIFIFC